MVRDRTRPVAAFCCIPACASPIPRGGRTRRGFATRKSDPRPRWSYGADQGLGSWFVITLYAASFFRFAQYAFIFFDCASYLLFHQTPEQLRRSGARGGARGGKAQARNRGDRPRAQPHTPPHFVTSKYLAGYVPGP
jgi:hypothetical protein